MKHELIGLAKKTMRNYLDNGVKKHYDPKYIEQINNLNINNIKCEGENEWIDKWSGFRVKPNPVYYRMFREYCGNDARIVPEDICRTAIETCLNPERFRGFYHDKNSWDMLFPNGILPNTVLRCIDGIFYNDKYEMVCELSESALYDILNKASVAKFAVKPSRDSNSSQGFDTININENKYMFGSDNEIVTVDGLIKREGLNFIIQPFMKQSSYLSQFCSTSVNPIRIQTYRSVVDGQVHILPGSVLRVGCSGEENDGTHGNGKIIGIDDNGKLRSNVLDYNGNIQHEFNGIDYNNEYVIPNYDLVKQLAINVASKVIHHRLLAFDIMLDQNNQPVMFEFNIDAYSMWISQFTGFAAFGEYTDEIIGYALKEKDNIVKIVRI